MRAAVINRVCQVSCFVELQHVSVLLSVCLLLLLYLLSFCLLLLLYLSSFCLLLLLYSTAPRFGMCDHVAARTLHSFCCRRSASSSDVLNNFWHLVIRHIARGYFCPSKLPLNSMIIVLCIIYSLFLLLVSLLKQIIVLLCGQ